MKAETFISIWGTRAAFARAIGEGESTVGNWFDRGSIPARHDSKIMAASHDAGRPVSATDLFNLRQNMMRDKMSSKTRGKEERISHAQP